MVPLLIAALLMTSLLNAPLMLVPLLMSLGLLPGGDSIRVTGYPISICRMTISILSSPISIAHISYLLYQDDHIEMVDISIYLIPNRYAMSHVDIHIDSSLMSDLPYRSPISISYHTLSLWPQ